MLGISAVRLPQTGASRAPRPEVLRTVAGVQAGTGVMAFGPWRRFLFTSHWTVRLGRHYAGCMKCHVPQCQHDAVNGLDVAVPCSLSRSRKTYGWMRLHVREPICECCVSRLDVPWVFREMSYLKTTAMMLADYCELVPRFNGAVLHAELPQGTDCLIPDDITGQN